VQVNRIQYNVELSMSNDDIIQNVGEAVKHGRHQYII